MKRRLIPETNQYKANLHCHSTLSDGKFTPEELKEGYKKAGYSVLAYSDHNVLVPHSELKDETFLPITSTEIDMTEHSDNWLTARTYHFNFFSKDEKRNEFIPVKRAYDINVANDMIKRAYAEGFLAMYNHPRWSLQLPDDYVNLDGLSMFEVYNTGCEKEMINGYGDAEYEIMLRSGKRLFPAATDDNHNGCHDFISPYNDSFGGFTMLCMDKLDYATAFNTMEKGDIYASTGPVIKEFYIDNNMAHIECSPCRTIAVRTESRATRIIQSNQADLTTVDTDISFNYKWKYIRLEIIDEYGNRALTRAYLADETI
ncbi:MAG: PHP domain-containing protein [Eubacteriales bacterium]|nr:PHP domain-containing protein [Eubacteriales bacterium]